MLGDTKKKRKIGKEEKDEDLIVFIIFKRFKKWETLSGSVNHDTIGKKVMINRKIEKRRGSNSMSIRVH